MKQKAKRITGTYRHFKVRKDGSLEFVGDVDYTYPVDAIGPAPRADRFTDDLLAARNAADLARHEADCAAFEDLVDRTCETEG